MKKYCGYKARENFPDLLLGNNNITVALPVDKSNAIANYFADIHKESLNTGIKTFSDNLNEIVNNEFQFNCIPLTSFNSIHSPNLDTTPFVHLPLINDLPEPFDFHPLYNKGRIQLLKSNKLHLKFTTTTEIATIIKNHNNKKSRGADNIPNFILRKLSQTFYSFILILFNHIFNTGCYPTAWKKATVIPILKPGKNPQHLSRYRPISLLSCLSKIYECVLHNNILLHCEDNNIIPQNQFGFMKDLNTSHALLKFWDDITTNINKKTPTFCSSLDCDKFSITPGRKA